MTLKETIMKKNPCYQERNIQVKGLMLHSVGCAQPSAEVFVKKWNDPDYDRACVHAFIDGNTGEVYQTLPWNKRGWHCGDSGNNTHIGVEICESAYIAYTSGTSFLVRNKAKAQASGKKTYKAAVELFAMLCEKYKLDPLKKGVIVSHREGYALGIASNHGDPEHYWKGLGLSYTMDGFRKAVAAQMKKKKTTAKPVEERKKETAVKPTTQQKPKQASGIVPAQSKTASKAGSYQVIAKKGLNLRKGPSKDQPVVTVMGYGAKVRCYGYHTKLWYLVQYEKGSKTYEGYCDSEFLKKN